MHVTFSSPTKSQRDKLTVYTMPIRLENRREEDGPSWMTVIFEWSMTSKVKCTSFVKLHSIAVFHQRIPYVAGMALSEKDRSLYRRRAMSICTERLRMIATAMAIIRLIGHKSMFMG